MARALYVDDQLVQTWTTTEIYTYIGGQYLEGSHHYYVEARDTTGNIARDPTGGFKSFTVQAIIPWQWYIVALSLTIILFIILFSRMR